MTLLPAAVILRRARRRPSSRGRRSSSTSRSRISAASGTWVAILLLAHAGALGDAAAISSGSGLQIAIALAALVGMGTKAGRDAAARLAAARAPDRPRAGLGADERRDDQGRDLRARARARRLARRAAALARRARARPRRALGASAASSTRSSSTSSSGCWRSTRSRTSGSSCSGSAPACCCARAAPTTWAAFALAAALLHTLNHAVFKALLFLGAGAFERAVGSLELDRLGGLLRRMPWTGGAFLVGAMAIAGLPPLNGFASEWLTLQALLHVPPTADVGDGLAGRARARRARRDRGARGLLLRQGRRARAARRRRAATAVRRRRRGAVADARGASSSSRCACVVLGARAGPALRRRSPGSRPGRRPRRPPSGLHLPGTGSLPTVGIALVLVGAHRRARRCCAARRSAAPAPTWACGQLVEPALRLDERGLHQAAAARARGAAPARSARSRCAARAASCRRSPTAAACRT